MFRLTWGRARTSMPSRFTRGHPQGCGRRSRWARATAGAWGRATRSPSTARAVDVIVLNRNVQYGTMGQFYRRGRGVPRLRHRGGEDGATSTRSSSPRPPTTPWRSPAERRSSAARTSRFAGCSARCGRLMRWTSVNAHRELLGLLVKNGPGWGRARFNPSKMG